MLRKGVALITGATTGGVTLLRGDLLALLLAGTVYVATVAPGPLWQDSGLAQNRTLLHDLRGNLGLALSHPLYYVFTILFQYLPFTESAYKTNLVSAVFGAVTVANVLLILRIWTGRWNGAVLGAISVAIAHTFWQHCALAEVYTLTTALLTAEILCAQQYLHRGDLRWLILLFLANGLGISNHMFASLSAVCAAGLVVYALWRGRIGWRVLPCLAAVWIAGASLYLWLIGQDLAQGMGLRATLESALTGNYSRNALRLLPSRRQLINTMLFLGLSFPTPAALVAFVGLLRRRPAPEPPGLRVYLIAQTLVFLVWAIRYDVPDQYTFFIPVIVLLGLWIGLGADRLLEWGGRCCRVALLVAIALPAVVYGPLPLIARRTHLPLGTSRSVPYRDDYKYFLWPWKTGYHGAERFVREICETLPPGSVLIMDSTTAETVWYAQTTGRWTDDIEVRPRAPRKGAQRERLSEAEFADAIREGRLFVVSPLRGYCPDWLADGYAFEKHGFLYRVTGPRRAPTRNQTSCPYPGCPFRADTREAAVSRVSLTGAQAFSLPHMSRMPMPGRPPPEVNARQISGCSGAWTPWRAGIRSLRG